MRVLLRQIGPFPLLTLAILLALPVLLPTQVVTDAGAVERLRRISEVAELAPYRLGYRWVNDGEHDIPPAARKLLRPNALLSRRYRDLDTGAIVDVLVVHCTDMRDMLGHYPPSCYPSIGWTGGPGRAVSVPVEGIRIPARVYDFSRFDALGVEDRIRVVNFFILPDGSVHDEMSELRHHAERRAVAAQGVAQVQFVTSGIIDEDVALHAASDLIAGLNELFVAVGLRLER